MLMAGSFLINIPSDGQTHTSTGLCIAAADNHLLAFLPLMRSAGKHQSVSMQTSHERHMYLRPGFRSAARQLHAVRDPDRDQRGRPDSRRSAHTSTPATGTLNYGESSHNESCFAAIYRYPVSTTSSLYDCAEGTCVVRREAGVSRGRTRRGVRVPVFALQDEAPVIGAPRLRLRGRACDSMSSVLGAVHACRPNRDNADRSIIPSRIATVHEDSLSSAFLAAIVAIRGFVPASRTRRARG